MSSGKRIYKTEKEAYRSAAEGKISIEEALEILKDQWLLSELVIEAEES